MAPEQALDCGARAREPRSQKRRALGDDRERLHQSGVAVRETADSRERFRARAEKLDALVDGGVREEAQRVCKPLCSARRREPNGLLTGFAQHGDRVGVALARRSLHVMGAGSCRGTAPRKRLSASLVRP